MRPEKTPIEQALASLPYSERHAILLRYGLGGWPAYTLEERVQIFKLSVEQIEEIESRAGAKLANVLGDDWEKQLEREASKKTST
jgi:DNA-directed RNA polymerase sigma subunit (sigma70/sigma32)